MARSVNQVLHHEWRERIDRQRESELSVAEFCRRENVSPPAFYAWKRRFRDATSARGGSGTSGTRRRRQGGGVRARQASRRTETRSSLPTGAPEFLQLPVTAARPSPWIELTLTDGTIVRLPQQNLAALVTMLRVLRGERLESPILEDGHA